MGRTLHFTAETINGKNFTAQETKAFFDVSVQVNSGQFANAWSCENFYLETKDFFTKKVGNSVSGFCKVQGNEFNSMLVLTSLVKISQLCKNVKIHLSDEGEFLYCSLWIREGKVLPDIEDIKNDITRFALKAASNSKALSFAKKYARTDELISDITGFTNQSVSACKDYESYLKSAMERLGEVALKLRTFWTSKTPLYGYNIKNLDVKDWFAPEVFSRAVTELDFKEYEMSPATMMGGFGGEYFGMSDTDVEKTSYLCIAKIMEAFGTLGMEISVIGEKK